MMQEDKSELAKLFKSKELLDQALTHRSWINENPGVRRSNERLEFLGDAILEFIVSENIFKKFPEYEEGDLTAMRANLVNTQNLSLVAKKLGLGKLLFLSRGEDLSDGRSNPSLLADTVEAIIGALYFDSGFASCEGFIKDFILCDIPSLLREPLKDAKSRLQELMQAQSGITPKYKVIEKSGPDHAKNFIVEVFFGEKPLGRGKGKSRVEAEKGAAEAALEKMPQNR